MSKLAQQYGLNKPEPDKSQAQQFERDSGINFALSQALYNAEKTKAEKKALKAQKKKQFFDNVKQFAMDEMIGKIPFSGLIKSVVKMPSANDAIDNLIEMGSSALDTVKNKISGDKGLKYTPKVPAGQFLTQLPSESTNIPSYDYGTKRIADYRHGTKAVPVEHPETLARVHPGEKVVPKEMTTSEAQMVDIIIDKARLRKANLPDPEDMPGMKESLGHQTGLMPLTGWMKELHNKYGMTPEEKGRYQRDIQGTFHDLKYGNPLNTKPGKEELGKSQEEIDELNRLKHIEKRMAQFVMGRYAEPGRFPQD